MRRVPGSSVVAGIFGVKTTAAAFEQIIRAAINATTLAAENKSSATLEEQLKSLQKAPQNKHQPFGLGVANYSPSMFAQPTNPDTKTPAPTNNNVIPLPATPRSK